jgi:DNA repair ATPase RecN
MSEFCVINKAEEKISAMEEAVSDLERALEILRDGVSDLDDIRSSAEDYAQELTDDKERLEEQLAEIMKLGGQERLETLNKGVEKIRSYLITNPNPLIEDVLKVIEGTKHISLLPII